MKSVVVVGLFVVICCLYHSANGARFFGKTDDCNKKPEGYENTCYGFRCNEKTGFFTVHTCAKSSVECQEGQQKDTHPEDLSKSYPDCCPETYCRDA